MVFVVLVPLAVLAACWFFLRFVEHPGWRDALRAGLAVDALLILAWPASGGTDCGDCTGVQHGLTWAAVVVGPLVLIALTTAAVKEGGRSDGGSRLPWKQPARR